MPKTVMIVEDKELNMKLFNDLLESRGYAVIQTRNGMEALDLARAHMPDLILMDIQMPVLDGIGAAREIRRLEAGSGQGRIPIVALTANALAHQVADYLAAGMDDHVAKPIEIAKLYETICTVMDRQGAAEARSQVA